MFESEAIQVTVATSMHGRPGAVLRAQVWNQDGDDHAEVSYERGGQTYVLSGHQALAFLVNVAQDAATLLAGAEPDAGEERSPVTRRPAGF